jgi:hypothetical protein
MPMYKRKKKHNLEDTHVLSLRRRSNSAGKVIPMHHSLATVYLSRNGLLTLLVMPVIVDLLLWFGLDRLLALWSGFFAFWLERLTPGGGAVGYLESSIFGIYYKIPYPGLAVALPSHMAVAINLNLTAILLFCSFFISKAYLPLTYFLRTMLLIQLSASVFFMISPEWFPYPLGAYIVGQMTLGIYILFLVAPILSLIYYTLDLPLRNKLMLTLMVLAYFIVAIPFQYMLHAYLISQWTFLFLPIFYLLFGALLDVLMFICMYSWAMTWRRNFTGEV